MTRARVLFVQTPEPERRERRWLTSDAAGVWIGILMVAIVGWYAFI